MRLFVVHSFRKLNSGQLITRKMKGINLITNKTIAKSDVWF